MRDRAGNTLMIVAAALAPMLALVGGGVDMGRTYLAESRLQQACDSGVLAARKRVGSAVASDGMLPTDANSAGMRFFNLNFRSGAYGSRDRSFSMSLESDYAVSGVATVEMPTTIMRVFGQSHIALRVACEARLNFSNTDIMMVLDTTGSMNQTNSGDSAPKISILREVVKDFHKELDAAKAPGTRIRYGFVPYSTNVNVGGLLKREWLVDSWEYEGRKSIETSNTVTVPKYTWTYTHVSGSQAAMIQTTGPACPASTAQWNQSNVQTAPDGTQSGRTTVTGTSISCSYGDGNYVIDGTIYDNYVYDWTKTPAGSEQQSVYSWQYKSVKVDLSSLASDGGSISVPMAGNPQPLPDPLVANYKGCIEERDTYEITDFSNVDLSKALDLDIDLVPSADKKTQWRPMLHQISFVRAVKSNGTGQFHRTPIQYSGNYLKAEDFGLSACPSPARKLEEMTETEIASYVDGLKVEGSTYHDIGMIWGGRLLSPTGLFAAENADLDSAPTRRHLIFLTDGETAPLDLSYATYGIEPLSRRRWSPSSPLTLTQTVENRFSFACKEVRKRNITVWVIGFGTTMTSMLKNCAGDGHWFQADDADDLNAAFSAIARAMGDLRISK
ncbi:hypothetical protein B2G71_18365 [Novosphingobium sp. PC22D]|nr:hypothetical protein B2G71_18365 [Novosphingobium sp. PC22D]